MNGLSANVEDVQTSTARQYMDCGQRIIEYVLMVYRIELCMINQIAQVRKFEDSYSVATKACPDRTKEVINLGYVSKDVVADQKVGMAELSNDPGGRRVSEKPTEGRYALPAGYLHYVLGWIDSKHFKSTSLKILEEVTVIAGNFQDPLTWSETKAVAQLLGHRLGVMDHSIGI
jgi:hypothetical protein